MISSIRFAFFLCFICCRQDRKEKEEGKRGENAVWNGNGFVSEPKQLFGVWS